jgi:hypothetical protein
MKRASTFVVLGWLVACSNSGTKETSMSREELLDPSTCKECHEEHYREWSASMHAYAADDPVFLAMNTRGQQETDGELRDFCVSCHAPMAVRETSKTDWESLEDVPQHLRGVTCYFCHNVSAVEGTHNNPLVLANDTTMRGNIPDPVPNPVHDSEYSRLVDGNAIESANTCGACHDIVVPKELSGAAEDVHLERTFSEWKDGFFVDKQSCATCHMGPVDSDGPIADFEGVKTRDRHPHRFPAVDVALTPFPEDDPDAERAHAEAVQTEIDSRLVLAQMCIEVGNIALTLDNTAAGHSIPSGASQDRRLWAEVQAFDGAGNVIFQRGVLADEAAAVVDLLETEPDLWLFRAESFDEDGAPAHMFWDIATLDDANTILGQKTIDPTQTDVFHREVETTGYSVPGFIARATLRLRMRPMGIDVLRDLVESGHLEERFLDAMPIHDVLPKRGRPDPDADVTLEWRADTATGPCVQTGLSK